MPAKRPVNEISSSSDGKGEESIEQPTKKQRFLQDPNFEIPKDPNKYSHIPEYEKTGKQGDIVIGKDGGRYELQMIQGRLRMIPLERPVRIYADGIYDLFHFGHMRSLRQAKSLFVNTFLIAGVCNDEITHKLKGKTVMTDVERVECVSHCRYVDEIIPNAPWVATLEFCEKHNIDFMTHGQDPTYDADGNDTYFKVKEAGKFLYTARTDGISTSDLIMRLIRDYDDYVLRNLKRGYSAKDMNVGFVKENALKLEDRMDKFLKKKDELVDKFILKFDKFLEKIHIKNNHENNSQEVKEEEEEDPF